MSRARNPVVVLLVLLVLLALARRALVVLVVPAVLGALAGAAGCVVAPLPEDLAVRCDSDADCLAGSACSAGGLCVRAGDAPPTISALAAAPAVVRRDQRVEVTFDVDEPLGAPPVVTLMRGDVQLPAQLVSGDVGAAGGASYAYALTFADAPEGAAASDGRVDVDVTAADAGGNVGRAALPSAFALDGTAPALASAFPSRAAYVRGDRVTYFVDFAEPVDGGSLVVDVAVDGAARPGFFEEVEATASGVGFVLTRNALAAEDDGRVTVSVAAVDLAGNASAPLEGEPFDVESTPPVIAELRAFRDGAVFGAPGADRIGATAPANVARVTFSASDDVGLDGTPRVFVDDLDITAGCAAVPVAAGPGAPAGALDVSCAHVVSALDAPGIHAVRVVALDLAGNEARREATLFYDVDGPVVVALSLRRDDGNLRALAVDGATGDPVLHMGTRLDDQTSPASALVTLVTTEPLAVDVDAQASATSLTLGLGGVAGGASPGDRALAFDLEASLPAGLTWAFRYDALGDEPEQAVPLRAALVDEVGNVTTVELGALLFDRTAPSPAPLAGGLLFTRAPNGDRARRLPFFEVDGAAASGVDPGAQLLLLDRADPGTALVVGQAFAGDADGALGVVALPAVDRPRLFARLRDRAGNDSAVVEVVRGRLVGSVGTGVAPLEVERVSFTTAALAQPPDARLPFSDDDRERAAGADGNPVGVAAAERDTFARATARPPPGALVFLPEASSGGVTGVVARVGADGVWLWDGARWRAAVEVDALGDGGLPALDEIAFAPGADGASVLAFGGRRFVDAGSLCPDGTAPSGSQCVEGTLRRFDVVSGEWEVLPGSDAGAGDGVPEARHDAAIAAAPDGRVFLFGGRAPDGDCDGRGAGPCGLLWVWQDGVWSIESEPAQPEVDGPIGVIDVGVGFDPVRGVVVVHGGLVVAPPGPQRLIGALWEWDGAQWTRPCNASAATPCPLATAVQAVPFVYDAGRGALVGGRTFTNERFAWDGAQWTQLTAALPSGVGNFRASTWDPARQQAVALVASGSTLVHDGGGAAAPWQIVPGDAGELPLSRNLVTAAVDVAAGRALLIGGADGGGEDQCSSITGEDCSDVWSWDGAALTERVPNGNTPVPVSGTIEGAFHGALGSVVVTAWTSATASFVEMTVLQLQGTTWVSGSSTGDPDLGTLSDPAAGVSRGRPNLRDGYGIAYDEARAELVMFSGDGDGTPADTWTRALGPGPLPTPLQGGPWRLRCDGLPAGTDTCTATPPGRTDHGVAYDPVRAIVVVAGGRGGGCTGQGNGDVCQDVWEWDGFDWAPGVGAAGPDGPGGRIGAGFAFDDSLGELVLFGGASREPRCAADSGFCRTPWSYDGQRWQALAVVDGHADGAPSGAVDDVALAPDPMRGGLFLWETDGGPWVLNAPRTAAAVRARVPLAAFDIAVADLLDVAVDAVAGSPTGARLALWDGAAWDVRASHASTAPAPLAHALGPAAPALLAASGGALEVRVEGGAPPATGEARVDVDLLEVRIDYRRP